MRHILKEEDGTRCSIFYHYKLIMRPEKQLDSSGMVRPDLFCNGYALVAELEACQHVSNERDYDFLVRNISIADADTDPNHNLKNKSKTYPEDNNNLVCRQCLNPNSRSRSPSPRPTPSPTPSPSPSPSRTTPETETRATSSPHENTATATQARYSNTHLSVADALVIMRNNTKHLGVVFASTSFVRLRLQGRPIDLPNEKKFAGAHGLAAATERALRQVERLHDEINFLHQYALKSEERDTIIPGDVVVEKRVVRSSKVPTLLIASVLIVVVVNNCFFKFPSLSFEF